MMPALSPVDLEKMATVLTLKRCALQTQLKKVETAIMRETEQINTFEEEVEESLGRMAEIERFLVEVQDEVNRAQDAVARKMYEEEIEELLSEQESEEELLEQAGNIRTFHEQTRGKLYELRTRIKAGLVAIKQRQHLVIAAALRLGVVKMTARKVVL